MIPPGAEIRSPRMTCPRLSLPPRFPFPPSAAGSTLRARTGCKNTSRLESIRSGLYRGSARASIDRPSLFIRKRINKRRGQTVYGARSDDKIGPCKSAGYLTGRRTIFEYLPSFPPSPLFRRAAKSLVPPARVLRLSPCAPPVPSPRQFFITSCSPNNLSFPSFFAFQGTAPTRTQPTPAPSRLKITKLGHG